ncbi:hypothetical protein PPERSA_02264 [Pseudocohnilembus persalinus]|uniref:Transmembrane protein n=1 Tax=Pseudocohnilembus persalinus TaxID=266149 RepID=A0A0V0QKQ2_PSEPJ|nr:hypothetical protein PPERSA_02264 [Pseudocohnilembus persalinus]|eukprot:KRX02774.1 hypothetical protein PPERSA_02264 [Pseudocohnilembus persalinus]
MTRIIQNQYYEKKKNTPFQSLSQATQEFITDPLDIQQLKSYHNIGTHYPDLVKIDYLKQQKMQGKKFNLQEEYYDEKSLISQKKKMYILLVNVIHVIGIAIIQIQIDYTVQYVPDMLRRIVTTLFVMPQYIVYIVIRLKKKDKNNQILTSDYQQKSKMTDIVDPSPFNVQVNKNSQFVKNRIDQKQKNSKIVNQFENDIQEEVFARNTEFQSPRKLLSDVYKTNDIKCDIESCSNEYQQEDDDQERNYETDENFQALSKQISMKPKI